MKFKKDFQLFSEFLNEISPDSLKAGETLSLKQNEDSKVGVYTRTNIFLGNMPDDVASLVNIEAVKVMLRSLKKNPENKQITSLLLRAEDKSEADYEEVQAQANTSVKLEEDDETLLQNSQLNRLYADVDVLGMLKDERLQKLLKEIDSSSNREKHLEQVLEANPEFRNFADKVLMTIDPALFAHLKADGTTPMQAM